MRIILHYRVFYPNKGCQISCFFMKVVLDIRRQKKDGTYPIVIQIKNRNVIRLSTGISCLSEHWDREKCRVLTKDILSKRKNLYLSGIENKIELFFLDCKEDHLSFTDSVLRQKLSDLINGGKKQEKRNLISYIEEYMQTLRRDSTKRVFKVLIRAVESYNKNVYIEDIDRVWLMAFEKWLSASGLMVNTVALRLRNLRSVFNYCIDQEYINSYPFRKYKIREERTRKRALSQSSLKILRDVDLPRKYAMYRDLFMLQFYLIGINNVDLYTSCWSDVVDGRLNYVRHKTSKNYSIKIEPEALAIMKKYKGDKFIIKNLDTGIDYGAFAGLLNRKLKGISGFVNKKYGAEILPPDLSTYWSRHTWATIASKLEIPKDTIAASLGHGSYSVTDIYIDFDMEKIDKANRMVIDSIAK